MTDWNESIVAKSGSGKTTTTIGMLVRLNGDDEVLEWIDPKGETDDWDQDRSGGGE
jgi:DNA helicase HerA-like ATPase